MSHKPGLRDRFRYFIDKAFAKGPLVLLLWLAIGALVLIGAACIAAILIPGIQPDKQGPVEIFWDILFQALTPNPFDVSSPLPFLIIILVVTIGSLFLVSILIGALTSGIEQKLEKLRQGRSRVLENDHSVILGWSHQVFYIIGELIEANKNRKKGAVIAILASMDKVGMEEEIRTRFPRTLNTQVICRSGSPMDPHDLEIVNPHSARSVVILPPEEGDPDASVIKTVLALTNNPNRRNGPYNIVTEIRNRRNRKVIDLIGKRDDVHAILSRNVIAQIMAQTSLQSGLSIVYTELLNFEGDEIYFQAEPSLVGKTYGSAQKAYEDSCIIGIFGSDKKSRLNPGRETIIGVDDRIIAIAQDDDKVILSKLSSSPVQEERIVINKPEDLLRAEKILLLGWNEDSMTIIRELNRYVAPGSVITIMAEERFKECFESDSSLGNVSIDFRMGDTTDPEIIDSLDAASYHHIIILEDTTLDIQEADARTLITLLHLRDIADRDATPFSMVSQMADLKNRELADVVQADDFIISDHLISLMAAQLSENEYLYYVFIELFDPAGNDIYLKPASIYIETGKPVNFYTIVEAASRRGETAIGYRIKAESKNKDKTYGVIINPKKSEEIMFAAEDRIIVLSKQQAKAPK
jgi:voltage-gated potassium channel Kch